MTSPKTGRGAWLAAGFLCAAALYPFIVNQLAQRRNAKALEQVQRKFAARADSGCALAPAISLRERRLAGLLASWETIGGCGAGTSTGGGGGIKWIGRNTSGGLFQLISMAGYTHQKDGYILSLNTQISRDLSEKWNFGFAVPLLYKYYRDPFPLLPVDISNSGVGDISALLTRRFGEINDTSLTLQVGFPTGTHDARYRTIALSQEKQLGLGKVTGTLILDHTLDQVWGLIVLGGTVGYRGGQNELYNYRAPVANIYAYAGYFMGPWVPSLGLTLQRFFGVDRDANQEQQEQLSSVIASAALEWSTDWLAIIGGVSLPYGWDIGGKAEPGTLNPLTPGLQPWTAAVGISVSPF